MITRQRALAVLGGAFVAAPAVMVDSPHAASAAYGAYVMAYFTETPEMSGANYGLHLAVSREGLNRTPLNGNEPSATDRQDATYRITS